MKTSRKEPIEISTAFTVFYEQTQFQKLTSSYGGDWTMGAAIEGLFID
jgi:hypothetical protein